MGRASCEPPPGPNTAVPSCSLEVDMRSPKKETLDEIRHTIEPMFQAGVTAENAGEIAAAVYLASISICVGLLNAACMTS